MSPKPWSGAGVVVLEELEHALARGAPILAEFIGGSFTSDAYHLTDPRPDGLGVSRCIQQVRALGHGVPAIERVIDPLKTSALKDTGSVVFSRCVPPVAEPADAISVVSTPRGTSRASTRRGLFADTPPAELLVYRQQSEAFQTH